MNIMHSCNNIANNRIYLFIRKYHIYILYCDNVVVYFPVFASSSHNLLPDPAMIEGRLFVAAWEVGLDKVDDQIYSMISHATEVMLRSAVICRY